MSETILTPDQIKSIIVDFHRFNCGEIKITPDLSGKLYTIENFEEGADLARVEIQQRVNFYIEWFKAGYEVGKAAAQNPTSDPDKAIEEFIRKQNQEFNEKLEAAIEMMKDQIAFWSIDR